MPFRINHKEHLALVLALAKWIGLGSWVGLLSGTASAVFLHALNWATDHREQHPYCLWFLPLAGVVIALLYGGYGKAVEGGNNLLLERVHQPNDRIPFRMVPLILLSTVLTHLFGGSAGREGTAVQMGGTLANLAQGPLRLSPQDHRLMIMAGISGGFGSVFGTPLAGTVFGLEVLTVGRLSYEALVPCFVAAYVGDVVTRALGIHHLVYVAGSVPLLTPWAWGLIVVAGASVRGSESAVWRTDSYHRPFCETLAETRLAARLCGRVFAYRIDLCPGHDSVPWPGLSLPLIARSFTPEGVFIGAFALKIVFTALTLGTGFKGGEVTPLFCIGACPGSGLCASDRTATRFFLPPWDSWRFSREPPIHPLPASSWVSNCSAHSLPCHSQPPVLSAYILSGHRGIYLSQQVGTSKSSSVHIEEGVSLRELRAGKLEVRSTNK